MSKVQSGGHGGRFTDHQPASQPHSQPASQPERCGEVGKLHYERRTGKRGEEGARERDENEKRRKKKRSPPFAQQPRKRHEHTCKDGVRTQTDTDRRRIATREARKASRQASKQAGWQASGGGARCSETRRSRRISGTKEALKTDTWETAATAHLWRRPNGWIDCCRLTANALPCHIAQRSGEERQRRRRPFFFFFFSFACFGLGAWRMAAARRRMGVGGGVFLWQQQGFRISRQMRLVSAATAAVRERGPARPREHAVCQALSGRVSRVCLSCAIHRVSMATASALLRVGDSNPLYPLDAIHSM
ncbi:hypothetical protein IWX47DRAFT_606770 [Phyllosticta citricarpa]